MVKNIFKKEIEYLSSKKRKGSHVNTLKELIQKQIKFKLRYGKWGKEPVIFETDYFNYIDYRNPFLISLLGISISEELFWKIILTISLKNINTLEVKIQLDRKSRFNIKKDDFNLSNADIFYKEIVKDLQNIGKNMKLNSISISKITISSNFFDKDIDLCARRLVNGFEYYLMHNEWKLIRGKSKSFLYKLL